MKNKKNIAIFLVKFFAIFTFFEFVLTRVDITFFQEWITAFQAELIGAPYNGTSIFIKEAVFLIVPSCTGLVSTIILGSIIFSLKKPRIKEKITIFLIGTFLLLIANQFRLYLVLNSAKIFSVEIAEIVHIISWFATTVAIIFAWYYFTKKLTKSDDFAGFL